jgi:hypothetical protein
MMFAAAVGDRSSTHFNLFLWFSILAFSPANISRMSVVPGLLGYYASSG